MAHLSGLEFGSDLADTGVMTATAHRIKVPVTDEQRAIVRSLHDASTPEGVTARQLIGEVPASDSALLAVLLTRTLNEITEAARLARLDAAYKELAEALASEVDEQAVDSELALAALQYAVGAGENE